MTKTFRQAQILQIVRTHRIYTQEELARELAAVGIPATQVTLSRDIRDLGLAKTANGYQELNTPAERPKPDIATLIADFMTDVKAAQNLLVVQTTPGNASGVAAALDAQAWPEVVGTLAGDDTILIVTPDSGRAEELRQRLLQMLE